jgi:hypothetical protein
MHQEALTVTPELKVHLKRREWKNSSTIAWDTETFRRTAGNTLVLRGIRATGLVPLLNLRDVSSDGAFGRIVHLRPVIFKIL